MSLSDDEIIDRFLKDELSEEEAQNFRKRVETDKQLEERVALERQLFESFNKDDWSSANNPDHPEVAAYAALFADEETARIKKSIEISQQAYQAGDTETPVRKLNSWWRYSAAAAVLILASLLFIFTRKQSSESLYTSYLSQTELPSVTNRGSEQADNTLAAAERLFKDEDFGSAIKLLSTLDKGEVQSGAYYIYLSLSLAEESDYDRAVDTMDRLIGSDLLDSSKGYWFKGLIYLRSEEIENAKSLLELIVKNKYYNHELAAQLLRKL